MSKKGTWPLLPPPSKAARCRSTGDQQAVVPPVLRAGSRLGARLFSFLKFRQMDGLAPRVPSFPPLQKIAMAVGFDAYFDFERTERGWLVDETPIQESSASENEYWALHMDPTGNALIFNMLGARDPVSEARLWEPLVH